MTDDADEPRIEDIMILIRYEGSEEPSRISWEAGSLKFETTRKSAVVILRGIALKLEGQR